MGKYGSTWTCLSCSSHWRSVWVSGFSIFYLEIKRNKREEAKVMARSMELDHFAMNELVHYVETGYRFIYCRHTPLLRLSIPFWRTHPVKFAVWWVLLRFPLLPNDAAAALAFSAFFRMCLEAWMNPWAASCNSLLRFQSLRNCPLQAERDHSYGFTCKFEEKHLVCFWKTSC